jgi:hypothetical protein
MGMISMPIGEKLWEETSRAGGIRITASEKGIQEDITFAGEVRGFGRLQGIQGRIIGTDVSTGKLSDVVTRGTVSGVLALADEFVSFEAFGFAKYVRRSPRRREGVVCLMRFIESDTYPTDFSWMLNTIVFWEGVTDPDNNISRAAAYEWLEGDVGA